MAKFAPPNDAGLKPWAVTRREWGRVTEVIVYAESRASAEYEAKGRQRYVSAQARRATPEDVSKLREYR